MPTPAFPAFLPSGEDLPVHYQAMQQDDIADVLQLERECFQPPLSHRQIERMWSLCRWQVLKSRDARGPRFTRSTVLAYGCFNQYGDEAHLLKLGCLRAVRGRHLGRWLLIHILCDLIRAQAQQVHLEVRKSNRIAIHLYTGFGFQLTGERRRYYQDGENALLYTLSGLQQPCLHQLLARQVHRTVKKVQGHWHWKEVSA